jgi:transposase
MWQPKNLTSEQKEERRLAALPLLHTGRLSLAQIARQLGVTRQAVHRWARRFTQGGCEALKRQVRSGRRSRLSDEQWRDLLVAVKQGARPAGLPTERWTLPRIQQVVKERFGIRFSTGYLSRRLRKRPAILQSFLDHAGLGEVNLIR